MKIKAYVTTGMVGSYNEIEFEVDDDVTEEEISEIAFNYVCTELINWGYDIVEE